MHPKFIDQLFLKNIIRIIGKIRRIIEINRSFHLLKYIESSKLCFFILLCLAIVRQKLVYFGVFGMFWNGILLYSQ